MQVSENLTNQRIGSVYFPLALSWIFMAAEGPICTSILQRGEGPRVSSAAFLVLLSLAIWIESPVIDLLSTATTLGKDRASARDLIKFGRLMMLLVTVLHALVALTPLYSFVMLNVVRAPADVAETARIPFIIMIPWSAFVGWRRCLQGLAIRAQRTRAIGFGTFVRMGSITVVGGGLAYSHVVPGLTAVALGLVCGVLAEAIFIQVATRETIAEHFSGLPDSAEPLTFRRILAFHVPLSLSTMILLSGSLIVAGALARSTDPTLSMASWQVASSVVWMFRTITFALPEMVITFYREDLAKPLGRYCMVVGGGLSAALILLSLTGLDRLIFINLLHAEAVTVGGAVVAFLACAAMPLVNALMSYTRAVLTFRHQTKSRLWAIAIGIGSLFVSLQIFVTMGMPGVILAPLALTISQVLELVVLAVFWRRAPQLSASAVS